MTRKNTRTQDTQGTQDAQDASPAQDAQDVLDVLDTQDTDAQDASPARRSYKQRGEILPVRDAHVMTYDRATDFYRKDRDARSLATRDLGTRVLFHVRDARDASVSHLIIATCVAFSLDSVTLEQGGMRHEFPMSRVIGIRRARLEDARELRAIRRETRAQERRAQKGQDANVSRVRTSVVLTSVADVL